MDRPVSYVLPDANGVLRVGTAGVILDSIVAAFQHGHSPETIHQQYPGLSLEEIYGAIAYYLGHPDDVNRYLKAQEKVWDEWREKADGQASVTLQRLRFLKSQARTNQG